MPDQELRFEDCYFIQDGDTVTLGNSRIQRTWHFARHTLRTMSLLDRSGGRSWQDSLAAESVITTDCAGLPFLLVGDSSEPVTASIVESPISETCLRVRFSLMRDYLSVTKYLDIYPAVPAIRAWLELTASRDMSNLDYTWVDSLGADFVGASITAVELHDLTDYTNHLATLREFDLSESRKLVGNNIFIENESGEGIFGYKESPVPNSQLYHLYYDFQADERNISCIGSGFHNLPAGQTRRTYAFTFGVYSGGRDGGILALKEYQAARYKTDPERDYIISANSWGDFSTDINEEKLIAEVEAAADLGIESVAVDAGWTPHVMGGDPDPVKFPNGFAPLCRRAKELGIKLELWMVPTRLDGAIDVLKEHPEWIARTNNHTPCDIQPSYGGVMLTGIELCNPECFRWMKDYFLRFYDEGFARFKMDTFQCDGFDSLEGDLYDHYEALRRLMHELVVERPGDARRGGLQRPPEREAVEGLPYGHRPGLTFTQDSTRTNRPIYDYYMDYGIIFLENRYQNRPIDHNGRYLPWKTLRNLWQVAPYIPPQKLNMELSNDEEGYTPEYLLATVMFANPLFWESLARISDGPAATQSGNPSPALPATEREHPESSQLPPLRCGEDIAHQPPLRCGEGRGGVPGVSAQGYRARLGRIIGLYKEHQAAIYAGHIFPLGEIPDGTAWTGFQSHDPETGSGYLIVYREDNPDESHVFRPKFLTAPTRFESLTDDSPAIDCEHPEEGLEITLPAPRSFPLYRYGN